MDSICLYQEHEDGQYQMHAVYGYASGTSPSFNCNQFTKDQVEYLTGKDGESHSILGSQVILASRKKLTSTRQ